MEDARHRGYFEAVEAAFFITILLQFDRIYFFTLNYECCPVSNQEVRQFSLSEAAALGWFLRVPDREAVLRLLRLLPFIATRHLL